MNPAVTHTLPKNKKIALILRHAERYEIKTMIQATEPTLTENGKNDSFNLGKQLSEFGPFNIYYSPVQRCKETAISILEGLHSMKSPSQLKGFLLDLGGPYIKGDWIKIAGIVDSIGQTTFIRKWFNGEFSDDMMPLKEAALNQIAILLSQLETDEISTINITHDWNIMILKEFFLNLKHEDIGQPHFLDTLSLYKDNDSVHIFYSGKSTAVESLL